MKGWKCRRIRRNFLIREEETLELLLSNHDKKCLSCVRSGQCELQELCQELGVDR